MAMTTPPAGINGGNNGQKRFAGGIFHRVNPAAILLGMGFSTFFAWYISGGGSTTNRRRATTVPTYDLGQQVGNSTITGLRTNWEYQLDNQDVWVVEEEV